MMFNITRITILTGKGPDHLMIHTDLPCPFLFKAEPSQQPACMRLDCSAGTGEEYASLVFPGVEVTTIKA